MESFGSLSQGRLDMDGFKHASWSSELVDADEDGYQELLFSGKDSSESRNLRRLVLFVPNDKRTYSAQLTGETTPRGTPRIQWLSNAAGTDAAPYRTALRQKARIDRGKEKMNPSPSAFNLCPKNYLTPITQIVNFLRSR